MRFWKNNRVDQEIDVNIDDIYAAYIGSPQYENWKAGANFDRGFRIFLTEKYGTFENKDYDKLADVVWRRIFAEFDRNR